MAEHLELVAEIPKVEKLTVQERLEYAKKRRAQQIRRWEREKDSDSGPPPRKKKFRTKPLTFEPQFMLLDAATRGDEDEVKSMLNSGLDANISNDDGLTALHQACIDGKEEIIDILLDHGANLDSVDRELWTPLHAATACGNEDIVEYLLDQGANIVAINADGNMAIDLAEDDEELREILEAEMEEQGYTQEKLLQLKEEEEKNILSDLKNAISSDEDMDLDQKNEQGATMVHIAAANCYEDALEFLLEHGAAVDITDKDGWQPIHGAAVWGNEQVLEMLVESGADLDARTPQGETPLSLCEDPELQQFLVDLKNKVKANKKQSGRRKRSNSRSLSVKRTSLKDKISISHNEAKAEAILRVHPQLAFLLPKGSEAKQQEQSDKPMDVTPAATTGQATQNSTTTTDIPTSRRETRPEQPDKTSSLTRPKDKENIDPVAKDKKYEDTGTHERKGSLKITVKTHTTTIDDKSKEIKQEDKAGSPRTRRSQRAEQRSPRELNTIATTGDKEAKTLSLPRSGSDSKQSSPPPCSLVSITTHSGSPQKQVDQTEPAASKDSSSIKRDSSLPRKPLTEKEPKPELMRNIVSKDSSMGRFKTSEETKSSSKYMIDVNSNSKPANNPKLNQTSKMISISSDNLGPRAEIASSGTGSLPKSTKTRHAPPPPIPRSSGSLSRSHEPEDTSGYPDSFSKRSRNSRENILDVVATGRLGTPETKPVSPGDVKIEAAAGTAKYTPTKEPYSNHHHRPTNHTIAQPTAKTTTTPNTTPTKQPTTRPTNQPTTRPTNQPTTRPTNQPTTRPTNQPSPNQATKPGQPTNTKQAPYKERYTKRDENDVLANDKVMYQDHVHVEREKKTCCVIM